MNVSLNTALYNAQGVDLINVEKVASDILNSAKKQESKVQALDYSKFNRASLGIDLYSSRTNAQLQKQIATTQAGLYLQSIDVAQLNSSAAVNLYSAINTQKNVSLTQSVQSIELEPVKTLEKITNKTEIFSTKDSNTNSSNGNFNPFANTGNNTTKDGRAN